MRPTILPVFLALTAFCASSAVSAETRYVSKTGSNTPPYTTPEAAATTIQAALDESWDWDVLLVGAGDYEESITIRHDGINLIGEGRDRCRIIVPDGGDSVGIVGQRYLLQIRGLAVVGGRVSISLFKREALIADCLLEGASEFGVYIRGWAYVNVLDTVFKGVRTGIYTYSDEDYYPGHADLFLSRCQFVDADTAVWAHSESTVAVTQCIFQRYAYGILAWRQAHILIDSCRFLEGRTGVSAMTMDGVTEVSNSVFAFNSGEALETDQRGVVSDSLFYANDCATGEWDGGYQLAFLRCTFLGNRIALGQGRVPDRVQDCIFWNNGRDVALPAEAWPATTLVDHSLINEPILVGKNGNISGDPRFVAWGAFNDTDNPIHVDASSPPGGNGSAEHPFPSLQEALLSFDFRLAADSPCIGAGALGDDMGYPAGIAPAGVPRGDKVAIEISTGDYRAGYLVIPSRVKLYAAAGLSARPQVRPRGVVVQRGAVLSALDFHETDVWAYEAELSDCGFLETGLSLYGGKATSCRVLGAGTRLGFASVPTTLVNCLLAGRSITWPTLSVEPSKQPYRLVSCTIAGRNTAVRFYRESLPGAAKLTNCIVAGPLSGPRESLEADHSLFGEPVPGEGNLVGEPLFANEESGDFRLRADSPCIDAGFNSPDLAEFDIAGMHRIMFGGKSLTVDMGAYEFYINKLEPVPGTNEAIFTWSSLADKTYSIFYTDDLFNWHTAIDNFPSSGNQTTSWLDDGSLTGVPPLLAPKRFYRLFEKP